MTAATITAIAIRFCVVGKFTMEGAAVRKEPTRRRLGDVLCRAAYLSAVFPVLLTACAHRAEQPPHVGQAEVWVPDRNRVAKVVMVTEFGFVVLDFGGVAPPVAGTVLDVVRDGQRVGRVRLDAPSREHPGLATADVMEGAPRSGDAVRLPDSAELPLPEGKPRRPDTLRQPSPR